jgi:hypothetical protein
LRRLRHSSAVRANADANADTTAPARADTDTNSRAGVVAVIWYGSRGSRSRFETATEE